MLNLHYYPKGRAESKDYYFNTSLKIIQDKADDVISGDNYVNDDGGFANGQIGLPLGPESLNRIEVGNRDKDVDRSALVHLSS